MQMSHCSTHPKNSMYPKNRETKVWKKKMIMGKNVVLNNWYKDTEQMCDNALFLIPCL